MAGGYLGYGRLGYVVIDPIGTTFTVGAVIAAKGNNKSIPAWDDGAEVTVQTSGTTTNATPLVALTMPIANSPIHIFQGNIQINGTTADGLNFKTWKYDFALSTSLGSSNLSVVPGVFFDAGTTTGWANTIGFSAGNLNISLTGAASTTIKWRVMVKLFGVNAAN